MFLIFPFPSPPFHFSKEGKAVSVGPSASSPSLSALTNTRFQVLRTNRPVPALESLPALLEEAAAAAKSNNGAAVPAQEPGLLLPKREADPSQPPHLRLLLRPLRRPGPGCRSSSACRSPPLAPPSLLLPEPPPPPPPPHAVGGQKKSGAPVSFPCFPFFLSSPRLAPLGLSLLRTAGSSSPHFLPFLPLAFPAPLSLGSSLRGRPPATRSSVSAAFPREKGGGGRVSKQNSEGGRSRPTRAAGTVLLLLLRLPPPRSWGGRGRETAAPPRQPSVTE